MIVPSFSWLSIDTVECSRVFKYRYWKSFRTNDVACVFKKVQYKLLMHRLAQMNVRFALMNSKRCNTIWCGILLELNSTLFSLRRKWFRGVGRLQRRLEVMWHWKIFWWKGFWKGSYYNYNMVLNYVGYSSLCYHTFHKKFFFPFIFFYQ